jgi:hypothetical protein
MRLYYFLPVPWTDRVNRDTLVFTLTLNWDTVDVTLRPPARRGGWYDKHASSELSFLNPCRGRAPCIIEAYAWRRTPPARSRLDGLCRGTYIAPAPARRRRRPAAERARRKA